ERAQRRPGARPLRRRATDARHRTRPDGHPEDAPARRTIARARAAHRRPDLCDPAPVVRRGGAHRPAGRAERPLRAVHRRPRGGPQPRLRRGSGRRLRPRRRQHAPPRLPRFLTERAGSDHERQEPHVHQFVNIVLNGLSLGMIYAAFALALVLIYRATRIINFAQAPMAMVSTFIALTVIEAGGSYWLALAVALVSGFVLGAVVERVIVRPVEGKSPINAVILTLGLFTALHALAAIVFGSDFRSFPAPFGMRGFQIGEQTFALTGFGIFTIIS